MPPGDGPDLSTASTAAACKGSGDIPRSPRPRVSNTSQITAWVRSAAPVAAPQPTGAPPGLCAENRLSRTLRELRPPARAVTLVSQRFRGRLLPGLALFHAKRGRARK